MKTLALPFSLLCLLTGCGPAPKPDARIALFHRFHHSIDSTQTVAVGIMTKLGHDADRIEAEKKQVAGYLQQSTATLAQLDQLDPAQYQQPTQAQAAQLTQLLAQEGHLLTAAKDAQNHAVQEARDLSSVKAMMGAK